jgi:CRISPR system Cascade subunit CasE
MFLSRLKLNTNLRRTQLAMASPNKFHGAIESAFEEKQERNLWRIDKLKGQYYLMILSKVKPNFDGLIEQFGYKGEVEEVKSYDYLLNRDITGKKCSSYILLFCSLPMNKNYQIQILILAD